MRSSLFLFFCGIFVFSGFAIGQDPLMLTPTSGSTLEHFEDQRAEGLFTWKVPYPGSQYFLEIYKDHSSLKPSKTYQVTNLGKVNLKIPRKFKSFGWRVWRQKNNGQQSVNKDIFFLEVKSVPRPIGDENWKIGLNVGNAHHEFADSGKFKDLERPIKASGTYLYLSGDHKFQSGIGGMNLERSSLSGSGNDVTITRIGARYGIPYKGQSIFGYARYHVVTIDSQDTFNANGSLRYIDSGATYEKEYVFARRWILGFQGSFGLQIDPDPQMVYDVRPSLDWQYGPWRAGVFGQYGRSKAFNVDDTFSVVGAGIKWVK